MITSHLLFRNLDTLSQTLNLEFVTRAPAVDVLDIISRGLEVAGCIVAPRHKYLVLGAVIKRLVQRNRWSLSTVLAKITHTAGKGG